MENTSLMVEDGSLEVMATCDLFLDLSGAQMKEVAALTVEYQLRANDMVLEEGEAARYFYVVIAGRGVAQLETDQGRLTLGTVARGDAAGWSALAGGRVYPASVKALTAMRVRRIDSDDLAYLMSVDSDIGFAIHQRLSRLFCRQYQAALEAFRTDE